MEEWKTKRLPQTQISNQLIRIFPVQRIRHFKVATDNSFNIGKEQVTFNMGYQRNQRQEFGNVLDPGEKELYFDLEYVNYNLQYQFAEKNNWKTTHWCKRYAADQ